MSYSNNWLQSLTESYMAEAKAEFENHEDCVEHFKNNGMSAADAQRKCHALNKDNFKEEIELTNRLMSIIEVLCEEAGLDANELMEETIKQMEDMGRAYGWENPAPEGEGAASARLARVKASMKRLGKRNTRYSIKTGAETARDIEDKGPVIHEPTADRRVRARIMQGSDIPVEINDTNFENMQKSIEGITDRVSAEERKREDKKSIKDIFTKKTGGKKPKKTK